jgi:hypothetical protein
MCIFGRRKDKWRKKWHKKLFFKELKKTVFMYKHMSALDLFLPWPKTDV